MADVDKPSVPRWRQFHWRGAIFLAVSLLAIVGFASGVGASERPGIETAGLLTQVYYAFGLFLFGGMDLGTPQGGPGWGRVMLWMAYFGAPLVTASALVEAIMRLVQPQALMWRRRSGHIIVGGCGRLTALYLERLREAQPNVDVLIVGDVSETSAFDELRDTYRAEVLLGDIASEALWRRLRVHTAGRIVLLGGDDFINLEAATRIHAMAPDIASRLIVHIADLTFMRALAGTALARSCHVFNGHQIAATHLVATKMLAHFERTIPSDTVVLAGFGRFGQTVLAELQEKAPGDFQRVVIVDLEAKREVAVFDEQIGFRGGYERVVIEGDLRDPSLWRSVEGEIERGGVEPVLVLGSGLDRTNFRMAMTLGKRHAEALIIVRSERRWAFAEAFRGRSGIQTVSVAGLVALSMPPSWFDPDASMGRLDVVVPGGSAVTPHRQP